MFMLIHAFVVQKTINLLTHTKSILNKADILITIFHLVKFLIH